MDHFNLIDRQKNRASREAQEPFCLTSAATAWGYAQVVVVITAHGCGLHGGILYCELHLFVCLFVC